MEMRTEALYHYTTDFVPHLFFKFSRFPPQSSTTIFAAAKHLQEPELEEMRTEAVFLYMQGLGMSMQQAQYDLCMRAT